MTSRRWTLVGSTERPWEREAIDFVLGQIPDQDPFHARALVDIRVPATGAVHDLDLIIVGASAVYLAELRNYPGRLEGDDLVWRWTSPEGRVQHLEHPLRALRSKARILAQRIEAAMRRLKSLRPGEPGTPVQPLVLLAAQATELQLAPSGRACVLQRSEVATALRRHEFPGSAAEPTSERITSIRGEALQAGLDAIGLRPRRGRIQVSAYTLGNALAEGHGYQDREAVHRDLPAMHRRARTYLVPELTDQTARLALRRAADRDASLLFSVREHPGVLTLHEYVGDAGVGPTLMLDDFAGGTTLREFLKCNPTLSFPDRVAILEQVALALAYCHRRVVYHGGLGPDAVLVRRTDPERPPEARIYNFQVGRSGDVSQTVHRTRFTSEPGAAYQAPELYSSADAVGPESDLFSLGALAFFLMTGLAPAQSGPELQQRLYRDGALDPRSASDVVPDVVADAIVHATRLSRSARGSVEHGADIGAWIEAIKARLCPPVGAPGFVSPLQARKGDMLRADLEVVGVLGRGASASVLEVIRDGQHYALKVSLDPGQDERLLAEAGALQRLRHPRIVTLHESLVLADRQCLLLSLAGTRTLQQAIDRHGSIDLDRSIRYGEDLLAALEHLEATDIGHRDLKPANLGEGSLNKQQSRLTLFDFSLADVAATQLDVGTEPYRDPYLPLRGRWDPAADRWSCAVVLHEMLTGVRPEWKPRGTSPLASDAALTIASERFDAATRDRLSAFFRTALARDVTARFASAAAMRSAWTASAEGTQAPAVEPSSQLAAEVHREVLASLADDAPLDALPLGVRARNALDRAGLTRAIELLALPDNRLSAIRGAGSKVAREIDDLRRRWLQLRAAPVAPPFFPHYRGHDLEVDRAGLPGPAAQALANAGLDRLGAVAAAPDQQLHTLARRHHFDLAAVHVVLQRGHDSVDARENPTTSQGWVDALLPPHGHVRRWLGLEAVAGRPPDTVRGAAADGAVSTTAVYRELARTRVRALQHPALPELRALVATTVDELGGVAPLPRAAEALRARLGEPADDPDALARAAALLRWTCELPAGEPTDGAADRSLHILRLHDDAGAPLWVTRDLARGELVRRLGRGADELAAREILAAPAEAGAVLGQLVHGTPLAALSQGRLLDLAAQASATAVVSSRLELYRRNFPADRALAHAAAALTGDLSSEEIDQRVRARYPEAAALPPRPELDLLLATLGLHWTGDRYRRRDDQTRSSLHTLARGAPRRPTAHPSQFPARTLEAVHCRDFEDRLTQAVRNREPLVLSVTPRLADPAAAELSRVLQRPPVLLDRQLLAIVESLARAYEIDPAVLHETDRAGDRSPEWPNLARLVEEAADRLADQLFPNREPLLLVRPGLLARYKLRTFVHRAIHGTRDDAAASLLFLIPCHRAHFIEDLLPVPGLPASQRLSIPEPWLRNEGRRAASVHTHPIP